MRDDTYTNAEPERGTLIEVEDIRDIPPPPQVDPEIAAIGFILQALENLPEDTQLRVLRYVVARVKDEGWTDL